MSVTVFTEDEQQAIEEKWTLPRFIFFPAGFLGLWSLAHQWPWDHWAVQAFWTLYTGYVMFCWTSCFHETAHQTLSGSRTFSIGLGRVLGTLIGVPYSVYRESHIRHHAYLNKPGDWELWPYSDPKASLWFRRVFVWFDLAFGSLTAIYTYGRIFFHPDSPITTPAKRRTVWFEYLGIVAFWGTLLTLVALNNAWWGLVSVWLLPHCVAGVYQSGRKLTEHLGMASYDPLLGTRTVISNNWFTRLCTFLNFDIFVHGPHHRHPRVAHDQLRGKMDDYVSANPDESYPVFSTYSAATWNMLPWMWRNPGVGMNVGAEAPESGKDGVDNFVADVTEEVLGDSEAAPPPRTVPAPKSVRAPKARV